MIIYARCYAYVYDISLAVCTNVEISPFEVWSLFMHEVPLNMYDIQAPPPVCVIGQHLHTEKRLVWICRLFAENYMHMYLPTISQDDVNKWRLNVYIIVFCHVENVNIVHKIFSELSLS